MQPYQIQNMDAQTFFDKNEEFSLAQENPYRFRHKPDDIAVECLGVYHYNYCFIVLILIY